MKLFDVKVGISGGRDFNDYLKMCYVLDNFFGGDVWIDDLHRTGIRGIDWDFKKVEIISGGAKGADSLAEKYAKEHGYDLTVVKADWKKNGKAAGFIRNVEMLKYLSSFYGNKAAQGFIPKHWNWRDLYHEKFVDDENEYLFAFWDGKSKGTQHMISISDHICPACVVSY